MPVTDANLGRVVAGLLVFPQALVEGTTECACINININGRRTGTSGTNSDKQGCHDRFADNT